jgi:hypothetical protein
VPFLPLPRATTSPRKSTPDHFLSTGELVRQFPSTEAPALLSASWVGSYAHWVPSLIRAALTLAFVPRSCRVSVKPLVTARRGSPSTNAAGPPFFLPPRCRPALIVIPALLLLHGRSPIHHWCSTRRPCYFPSTGEPLLAAPPRGASVR